MPDVGGGWGAGAARGDLHDLMFLWDVRSLHASAHAAAGLLVPDVHGNYCCLAMGGAETSIPAPHKDDSEDSWRRGRWLPV